MTWDLDDGGGGGDDGILPPSTVCVRRQRAPRYTSLPGPISRRLVIVS